MSIRVLIVDDHSVVRQGLRNFLALDPELEVVGAAADGNEAVELARQLKPDVVLMDVMMPDCDGFTATAIIRREIPDTQVVILTSSLEDNLISRAIVAGASGYLLKNMEADELCKALKSVVSGHIIFAAQAMQMLVQRNTADVTPPAVKGAPQIPVALAGSLTERERDVVHLLAQGKTNKEIAYNLGLSDKTVKLHVSIILAKLGMHSRTQAALYAVQLGLIPGQSPQPLSTSE